jgi:prepilin signal peptidase PulO-like enzyme (type II secretory pathway)
MTMIEVLVFILGLVLGSFALAMTERMYAGKNWVSDRSCCDACNKTLAPRDLVPVLSWVIAGGASRCCGKKLSRWYPLVEICSGFGLLVAYMFWPFVLTTRLGVLAFGVWAVLHVLLVSLIIFDLKWFILPNKIVYAAAGTGLVIRLLLAADGQGAFTLANVLLSLAVSFGIFYAIFQLSKGTLIGGGDVKYGLVYGILLASPLLSVLVIMFASVAGTLINVPALINKKSVLKKQIPFGPYLIIATVAVFVWGTRILDAYSTLYLFP